MTIDACLILTVKGIWRAAGELYSRRIVGEHETATASSDPGDDNFDKLAFAVAAQDRWLIAEEHEVRSDADFLAGGRRFFANITKRIKPALCSENSPIAEATEDAIEWISGEMRKELFKGEISAGLAYAISGLAAAIGKVGLEKFCQQEEVRMESEG
jgi:hypothetical protein